MKPRLLFALLGLLAAAVCCWLWLRTDARGSHGRNALAVTTEILALGPRPPGSPALEQTRRLLAAKLAASGWASTSESFERNTPEGQLAFANLRARFGAADDPTLWSRPVDGLLGCHIDSKRLAGQQFLGADDAASAAGAIIEIARVLGAKEPKTARRLELVFFDGEEALGESITPTDGLYGSRQYAAVHLRSDPKPNFAIVLDMIGHRNLTVRIPSDTPKSLSEALFQTASELGVGHHFGTAPGPIIDDHVPLQAAGVPSIDVIGDFGRGGWWHTSRDNAHLLDAESLDVSIRVTLGTLRRLLDSAPAR